ncbi:MAG TPA: hypothetical protein VGJ34_06830 [Gaiellaceae bacterium]|jgi:uncharacterized BrkB/YihY/UPF0761 family membrane protein
MIYFSLFALGTTIWVAVDARKHDWSGNRIGNKTWRWIVGVFFIWAIVFPLYVFQRRRAPLKA